MQGIVEKIQHKKKDKSYGFIRAGEKSFYFKLGDSEFKQGDPVIFKEGKNEKGNVALDVKLATSTDCTV